MTPHPYTYLSQFMNPDYQQIVVGRAIKHFDNASNVAKQRLEKAVRNAGVQVPGFRPGKAPPRALAKPLLEYFVSDPNIARAVFTLWLESQEELGEQVSAFLQEKGLAFSEDLPPKGFSEDWSAAEMEALAEELGATAESDRAKYDDTALMLVCLLGRAPLRPAEADPEIAPASPPDAPDPSDPLPEEPTSKLQDGEVEPAIPPAPSEPSPGFDPNAGTNRGTEHEVGDPAEVPVKLKDGADGIEIRVNDSAPIEEYERLREQLAQAQSLLEDGAWQDLAAWADSYEQQVRRAIGVFAEQESSLAGVLVRLAKTLADSVPPTDAGSFTSEMEALSSGVMTRPAAWALRAQRCQELERSVEAYLAKRGVTLLKRLEAYEALTRACENGRVWGVADDPLLAQTDLTDASGPSLDQLTAFNDRLREALDAMQKAAMEAKSNFIAAQQSRSSELRDQLSGDAPSAARDAAIASFDEIDSVLIDVAEDWRLLAVPNKLNSIHEAMSVDSNPDLAGLTQAYLETQDQADLDRIFEGLWAHGRTAEAFVLLTAAVHAGRRPIASGLQVDQARRYLRGLLDASPEAEFAPAAAEICLDDLISRLLFPEDSAEGHELLVLAVALFAAYPFALDWEVLRRLKGVDLSKAAPTWARLVDCIQQDAKPTLVSRCQLDTAQLTELCNQLTEELRREGGRYVHASGDQSKTLHNMEQRYLLPSLEKHWKILSASTPDQPTWRRSHAWVATAQTTTVLEEQCRAAGVINLNGFYRRDFEDRVTKILDAMREFADLRRAGHSLLLASPFAGEDLLDELTSLAPDTPSSLVQIAQACIQLRLNTNFQGDHPEDPGQLEAVETRLAKMILNTPALYSAFPSAATWIAGNAPTTPEQWLVFFDLAVQDLVHPADQAMLIEGYLTANLPQIAMALAGVTRQAEAVEQTRGALDRIKKEVKNSLTHLKELGGTPDGRLDVWLQCGRYGLVLEDIDRRIASIERDRLAEAARQREELRQVYTEAVNLELRVSDALDLPPNGRADVLAAVQEIRNAWFNADLHNVEPAREVVTEIRHLLDYPGSTADGIVKAKNQLRLAKLRRQLPAQSGDREQTVQRIPSVDAVADALRAGKLDLLGLETGALTQNQCEVRYELLDTWQRISTLTTGGPSLRPEAISSLQSFARLFSQTTGIYSQTTQADAHTTWLSNPSPSFRTELISPRVSVLKRRITLIFTTGVAFTAGQETVYEEMIKNEDWLREQDVLAFVAPLCPLPITDWIARKLPSVPTMVLNERRLLEIVQSVDNPTATGAFRRMLLQSIPSKQATVFTSENLVDSERDIYVGRRDWKDRLVERDKNFAVYGGRRIGKTSLLNAVNKELLKQPGFRTAYVSVEGEIAREHGGLEICRELLQKLSLGRSCSSFTDFKSRILNYLDAEPDVRVVILLDELDRYIVARREDRLPHDLIHTFRTIYQETNGRCRFILAGFIQLWKELTVRGQLSGADTPWFNFLVNGGPLAGLDDSDAQAIIRQGFQDILGIKLASGNIPRLIIEKTTNHPAFVQKFCERLHARLYLSKSDCLTEADVEAVFNDRSDDNFVSFVNETLHQNLLPLPRLIVYLLAVEGKESFGLHEVKNVLGSYDVELGRVPDEKIRECLDELKITSVIRPHQRQDCYRFSVPSYPKILREFETANTQAIPDLITAITKSIQES